MLLLSGQITYLNTHFAGVWGGGVNEIWVDICVFKTYHKTAHLSWRIQGGQIFCKRRSSTDQNIGLSHYEAFQRGVEFSNQMYVCVLSKGQCSLKNES